MPIQFDNFDQSKIDRLKTHLVSLAEKQRAKFYEIFVDGLKAVPKTDDPKDFEGYEDYLTPDSAQVKIVIYNSGASPRNDQYVFVMKAKSREEAISQSLEGMSFQSFSKNSLSDYRSQLEKKSVEAREIQRLKQQISELNEDLEEKEDYIDELEETVRIAKENGNKIGGFNVSDILSAALEGMVRRNTHLLAEIPGVQGLAGIIEKDNQRMSSPSLPQGELEATFRKKDSEPQVTEEERQIIGFFQQLQQHFSEQEFNQAMMILDGLSRNKEKIQPVLDLINNKK